ACTLLDLSVFRNDGFAFGFIASFAAGFALFGSAYLLPSFAISVLRMTPTEAGMLLLPSSLMFVGALLLTAFLVRRLRLPPITTVPFGVLGFIIAMWMLSGSNGESGIPDLLPAVLLRGLALGFLFFVDHTHYLARSQRLGDRLRCRTFQRRSAGRWAPLRSLPGGADCSSYSIESGGSHRAHCPRPCHRQQLEMISRQLAAHGMEASAATKAA